MLRRQQRKALRLPFGEDNRAFLVRLGVFDNSGSLTLGARQNVIGVRLPLVDLPFTVLSGFDASSKAFCT